MAAMTVNVCEDRRVADFIDCLDRGDLRRAIAHLQMPIHVLDYDDRVVHEYANRKDQCEQGYSIERVAEGIVREQCESESNWYCDENDRSLTPSKEDPDQHCYGQRCDEEMQDQLLSFVAGCLAIVTCDVQRH
jgi:hypothetical protein